MVTNHIYLARIFRMEPIFNLLYNSASYALNNKLMLQVENTYQLEVETLFGQAVHISLVIVLLSRDVYCKDQCS